MDPIGNDGLTDAERHESAERWRNGAGKAPTKEELEHLRAVTPVTYKSRDGGNDLCVTQEFFDELAAKLQDPVQTPDPKLVSLFREMRPQVLHVGIEEASKPDAPLTDDLLWFHAASPDEDDGGWPDDDWSEWDEDEDDDVTAVDQ